MLKRYLIIFLLSVSALTSQAQWTALSGPPGANVQDLERSSGGALYMISNKKLFTSTDNGDSWIPVAVATPSSLSLEDIFIDGNNKMYGVNSSQAFTSIDGGLNWTKVSMNGQFYGMSNIMKFGPHNMLAIYGSNGMYVSSDDGVNWIKIHDTQILNAVATSAGTLFAGSNYEGIKRYIYPGVAGPWNTSGWTLVSALPHEWNYSLYYDNATSIVYASLYATNDVIQSTNNGTNWSSIKGAIAENIYHGKWAKSPDGKIFLANYYGNVYYTPNTGSACSGFPCINWTVINNGPTSIYGSYITELVFQDANTLYVGMDGDAVFKTTNILAAPASVAWEQKATGLNFGNGTQVEVSSTGRILYLHNSQSRGYWTSTTGGTSWTFTSLDDNIRKILKLANGSLIMYGSGVYRAEADGATFIKVSPNSFAKITESSGKGNLYAITANQIYTSIDQGTTWEISNITGMPAGASWYYLEGFALDNNDVIYATIWDNSVNPGKQKFYKVIGGAGAEIENGPWISETDAVLSANNVFFSNNKIYLSESNAFFESSDSGVTWKTITFSSNFVFPINGGICVSRNGNPGSLYVTQDGGQSWNSTVLPSIGGYSYITDLAVDAAGDFIASAHNSPALKNTSDLVVDPATLPPYINFNWQPTSGPYGGHTKRLGKNSSTIYGATNGDLYKTTSFSTWQNLSSGDAPFIEDFAIVAGSSNTIYGLTYSGLSTSIDEGVTWTSANDETAIVGRQQIVRLDNGKIAFYASKDGGEVYVSSGATAPFTFGSPKYELSATEGIDRLVATADKIYISVWDSNLAKRKLYQLDNNGANIAVITPPATLHNANYHNVSTDATTLYMWGDGKELYKSSNNGSTWTDISGDLTQDINFYSKVYASPTPNELYLVGTNNRLYRSVNNGANWTAIGAPFGPTVYDIMWLGTRMVFATEEGIFTSEDAGATRILNSTGINGYNINDLYLAGPNRLYAGNYSRRFLSTDFQTWARPDTLNFDGFVDLPDGSILAYDCQTNFKSTNGGQNWVRQTDFTSCTEGLVTPDGVNFYDKRSSKIFYTNNLAGAWTELTISGLPAANHRNYLSLAVDANGIAYLVLYNNQISTYEFYQILFGSAIKLSLGEGNPINVQYRDGKILVFYNNGSIFETTDGSAWSSKSAPGGDKLIIAKKGYYFIPQSGAVLWLSRNQGQTWQSVGLDNYSPDMTFTDIDVNESTGYAYGSLSNSPVRKSANIIIPDDLTAPSIVTFSPSNNATNVLAGVNLTITFNELVVPQATKTLRIVDLANPVVPVETINVTAGTISGKSITFNPVTTLTYLKTYFIVFDNGSFKDIFGNTHAGIINNATWRFTIQDVPDVVAPAISYTQSTFTKGQTNTLSITVTDNAGGSGINASTVKLFYRGTMSSAAATEVTIPNTVGNTYQISVSDAWPDELGLEFYFMASDVAGNSERSPIGTGYHHVQLDHPDSNKPVIPSGFIGIGGKAADYKMFSIPYDLQNSAITTVFNELGLVDNSEWRVVQYINSSNSYSDASAIVRGTGYWINSRNSPSAISVEGATTPNNTKTNEFSMHLKAGWNLIGNPYPFTINWALVKAASANIGDVKTFNGAFSSDNILSSFEAGFVFLNGTSDLTVKVPFSAKSDGRMHESTSFEGGWLLPLTLDEGELKNILGGVGMHKEAKISYDQFDDVSLPQLFDIPEIHFSHPEHFMKRFTRDIVPVQEEFEWRFTVHAKEGSEIVLSWDSNFKEFDKDLFLLDESTQTLVNMLEQDRYSFLATESSVFKVFYGTDLKSTIKPTRIMLGAPFPNPTQGNSSISFTLPENVTGQFNVMLDVFDLVGNKITTLISDQLGPGFYTIGWSPQQHQLSAGLYIYKLSVNDNTNKKNLTRKLLIK